MNFKDELKTIGRCFGFDLSFLALPIAIFVITTILKIWWMPFPFLAVLFLLKKYKKYTKVLSSKYISFWIDRIFFLCLTFTPVIFIYCIFSKHMEESNFSSVWLIIIFFSIALVLYVIEKKLPESDSLKNRLQQLARFAPLFIGICLFVMGGPFFFSTIQNRYSPYHSS